MKKAQIILLLLFICQYSVAQYPEYGLHIQSFPINASKYTSMVLDNGEAIETEGEKITLDFKLWVRKDNVFGTVFRIITNDKKNIDLMYSVSENDRRFPILVTGESVHPIQKEIKRERWINVHLILDSRTGKIDIYYDNKFITAAYQGLKKAKNIRIAFGYCPFENYSLSDVASINIKDISLYRDTQKIRFWKMARHNGDTCYDEIAHSAAVGKNTCWIIDQYITWKHIYTQKFSSSPSIAFDPNGSFFIAKNKHKLYIYHADKQSVDTIQMKGGEFAANYPNQLIFIPKINRLLSYNLNENIYSAFNPITQHWENNKSPIKEHDYWNNTIVYDPSNSSLISFGGYGHYRYNNELLISYPWNEKKPQKHIKLTNIYPRYSAASTIIDSILYIFGGRGCPSGRQELSPRNYYDFYAVDLHTLKVKKLWEAPQSPEGGDFQPGENLIYDPQKECFYLFSTQQGGILMKIDKNSPHFEIMSLPIRMKIDAQYIYTNLYYSPKQKKLYVATHQAEVNGKASLDIYELNYPPISVENFKQNINSTTDQAGHNKHFFWLYIIGFISIGTSIWLFYRSKRKLQSASPKKEQTKGYENNLKEANFIEKIPGLKINMPISNPIPVFHNYDFSKKCICFFGGFRVIDKEGNDLTTLFTPTLKALLILLILYTGKDSRGVTGHRMIQLLWYDKSDESAKNNRNVYMSRLRGILEKVGEIKIQNQGGLWYIEFEEGTFCDYLEALQLYRENNSSNLEKLLELLLRGMMLPNTEIDWIDSFKNNFSDTTIDLLSNLLKQENLSDTLRLKIADTLFQHDYINEEALCLKCRILCQQGKKGLAKTVYDSFCKEYYTSMGTEYKFSLMEIIERTL